MDCAKHGPPQRIDPGRHRRAVAVGLLAEIKTERWPMDADTIRVKEYAEKTIREVDAEPPVYVTCGCLKEA